MTRPTVLLLLGLIGCAVPEPSRSVLRVESVPAPSVQPHHWRNEYNQTEGHGYRIEAYGDRGQVIRVTWCTEYCHHPLCDSWGSDQKCPAWKWDANGDGTVDLHDYACIQNTATIRCCRYNRFGGVCPCD